VWKRQTGQYGGMGLAEIADRLYGVHPGEFTHSRDDEVRAAKAAGDSALAARVKLLRRPSTSAWLVNTLVRQAPDQLDELLQLGEELRAAQLNFGGPQLRRLVERRRSAISELTVTAVRLSVAAGHQVGDAVMPFSPQTDPDVGVGLDVLHILRLLAELRDEPEVVADLAAVEGRLARLPAFPTIILSDQ